MPLIPRQNIIVISKSLNNFKLYIEDFCHALLDGKGGGVQEYLLLWNFTGTSFLKVSNFVMAGVGLVPHFPINLQSILNCE